MNSCRPAFNAFIRSQEPPLDFGVPAAVLEIGTRVVQAEHKNGRQAENGFVRSGVFTSYMNNKRPNDVDICIFAPDLVKKLQEIQSADHDNNSLDMKSYKEMQERVQILQEQLFPRGYPLRVDFETLTPITKQSDIGLRCQFTGAVNVGGRLMTADILCGSDPVTPEVFFARHIDAPIRSIAYEPDSGEYIYHRDFPDHAKDWRFAPFEEPSRNSLGRARAKGMEIVLPGQR